MDIIKDGVRTVYFPFQLRPLQKQILENIGRFGMIVAHRRFGKTMMCVLHMILSALTLQKKQPRYWYIFPQEKQARMVVLPILKDMAQYIPNSNLSETRLELTFDLGDGRGECTIALKGVDKGGDNLRGSYLDGVVLDEMKDMPLSAWQDVIRPMLSDRLGWGILTGTAGQGSWYEIWEQNKQDPNPVFTQFDYKITDTKLIPDHEIESLKKTQGLRKFNREYMNDWFSVEDGAYYADLLISLKEQGKISDQVEFNPSKPVVTAWDLGAADATAIWFIQEGDTPEKWKVIDYLEYNKSQLLENGEKLEGKPFSLVMLGKVKAKKYFFAAHVLPHDAVHQHHSASLSTYEILKREAGCKIIIAPKQSKKTGIEAVQNLLPECSFNLTNCIKGLGSLHSYRAKLTEDGVETTPENKRASHGADAFSYFASSSKELKNTLNFYRFNYKNTTKKKIKSYNPFS